MKIPFIKMHGAGNDYIFVDCFKNVVKKPENLAAIISNRHFGVGADGLVLILPSVVADCKMRIFNADGSEAEMCGNAVRCIGKYFYENIDNKQDTIKIETNSGIKTLELVVKNGVVNEVKVDMGKADFCAKNIPILTNFDTYINMPVVIFRETKNPLSKSDCPPNAQNNEIIFNITAVSMGNPHAVVFCKNVDNIPLATIGTKFEHHALFPERVNTEFVQIVDKRTIKMRVWERGSGETMACGTGACASVAAAIKNNLLDINTEICVKVKGGELFITCLPDCQIYMHGNTVEVFRGEF
jgi:diaminopimelate epimerase